MHSQVLSPKIKIVSFTFLISLTMSAGKEGHVTFLDVYIE